MRVSIVDNNNNNVESQVAAVQQNKLGDILMNFSKECNDIGELLDADSILMSQSDR